VPVEVLASGDDWIAVAKPPGVLVHRSGWAPDRDVMLTRVRDAVGHHVYPVHRLDRPTSGCLLFGLDSEGATRMKAALEAGVKTYVTLVRGQADALHGLRIDRPLKPEGGGEPKPASTFVEVLGSAAEPRCSLVLAKPATGRYHQIRRHLAGRSHPVLGDSSHGDTRCNRDWKARGLPRLLLHCARMELPHPDGRLDLRAPMPPDMAAFLATLPFYGTAASVVPDLLPSVRPQP
jgi:tRNA pseudouridine65 synthase